MVFFEWDPKFSVNIVEIDEQHKRLIGLIDRLHGAVRPGSQDPFDSALKELVAQASVINEMVDYSHYHFSTEERYMQKYLYPGYEMHKEEHDSFIREVRKFKNDFDGGKVLLSIDIMQFLKKWVGSHILGTDKQYVPLFKEKGLE